MELSGQAPAEGVRNPHSQSLCKKEGKRGRGQRGGEEVRGGEGNGRKKKSERYLSKKETFRAGEMSQVRSMYYSCVVEY